MKCLTCLFACLFVFSSLSAFGGGGNTNAGTEFYFSFPPCYEESGANNSSYLYVSSAVKTRVTVEVVGKGITYTKETIPNDVIAFQIAPGVGQAYTKGPMTPPPTDKVYSQMGLHIYAEDPIIVYGATRFAYTSDTFLAIPVSALGKEYIVASMADMSAMYPGYYLVSETTITAAYDSTTVNFTLGGNIVTRTAGGMKPGDTRQYTLAKKGDVLVISSKGNEADLSGSKIISDKPVAVVSGNQCANVPVDAPWCDFIAEMELPMHTWGTAYHVTKIKNRLKCSCIKIFAKEDNTTIYRDGVQIGFIPRAGGTVDAGYLSRRVVADGQAKSYVISGDKPISVTQFNTGQSDDNVTSDPFQLVLTPIEQFQKEITFNTPGINGGFGFMRNHLSLVYELNQTTGQIPDDLEYASVTNGQFQWVKVKTKFGAYIGEEFGTKVNNKRYACKLIDLPGDGVYKIRANTPFTAYAYGFSDYDSYGHPTSVSLGDLTKSADTLAPVPAWTMMDCNGNISDGTVKDFPEEPELCSNLAMVYIDNTQSFNYTFSHVKLATDTTRETTWTLNVINPIQDAKAVLIFIDRAGNTTTATMQYSASIFASLTIEEKLVDFGKVNKGEAKNQIITVKNISTTSSVTVSRVELKNKNQNFSFQPQIPLPFTLKAQESKTLNLRFVSTTGGVFQDTIGIGENCVTYPTIVRAEIGLPIIQSSDFTFATIVVGQKQMHTFEIKNVGDDPLTIFRANGPTNNEVFSATFPQFPLTLAPNQSVNFTVQFSPKAGQLYNDQIVFDTDSHTQSSKHDPVCMLAGIGVIGLPVIQSSDFDFMTVTVGQKKSHTFEIRNVGNDPLTVFGANGPTDKEVFSAAFPQFPFTIAPSKSTSFTVQFIPKAEQYYSDQIVFNTDSYPQSSNHDPICLLVGIGLASGVEESAESGFFLSQNIPNPTGNIANIRFGVEASSVAELAVYSILGEKIATLHSGFLEKGEHSVRYDVSGLPVGTYYYRLTSGEKSLTRLMSITR